MKSYNHLFEKVIEENNIRLAIKSASLGKKKKRRTVNKYLADIDRTVELAKGWVINYKNDKHTPVLINDGIKQKKRTIIVPTFKELVSQHAIINVMKPVFMKGMYEHSYASIPDRGVHRAKKVIEKWINHDSKNVKYVLQMDIKHFFDEIPHDILKEKLKNLIHDDKMLKMLYEIIDVTDVGLPLGFYTSQWLSNWYLQDLDHYIKEILGATHYVRYMDDMIVFGSNKKTLHRIKAEIEKYLSDKLGLRLKQNWQVFRFSYIKGGHEYGRDLDFMGFRFFRNRTTLRRSIMLKATRKAKKVYKKSKLTIFDIRQAMSYLGWLNCTDTYLMYTCRIRPYVNYRYCKKRLSNYDKRNKIA